MPSDFVYQRRAEFADTDAAGMLHFTALLRFMEEAEHAYYRLLGFHGYRWSEESVYGIPRVSVSCKYLKPVYYNEVVGLRLAVLEARRKAIRYSAEATVERAGKTEVVARGDWTVVCARRQHGRREWTGTAIPEPLRRKLEPAVGRMPRGKRGTGEAP